MGDMIKVNWVATILVIIGALNWGLAAFNLNLVNSLFGFGSTISKIIYGIIGLSGLWLVYTLFK